MRNLEEYVNRCIKELEEIGLECGNISEIKVNTRAKKRWGQCKRIPNGYQININVALLDERSDERGLKETIIHELLHSCKGCMNHGENWKRLADAVNEIYGYNIKRCNSAEEKGVSKEVRAEYGYNPNSHVSVNHSTNYTIKCGHCGHTYTRTRKSKVVQHPEHYRCGYCGGNLILI